MRAASATRAGAPRPRPARVLLATILVLLASATAAAGVAPAATKYGDIQFPRDEHGHIDGWDFWWGSAEIVTRSGNEYFVGVAFDSLHGVGVSGHEIYPQQGPYDGRSIMTADGPKEWGHEGNGLGRVQGVPSLNNPLLEQPPAYHTYDLQNGLKDVGLWERPSLNAEDYHLRLDHDDAWVHPTGEHVKAVVDLEPAMKSPPLLAGGGGLWWYGIPETFDYDGVSRSYQYMQGAETLTGTLEIEQPDGSILRERVDPRKSRMLMVREYDASPEDLYAGLGLAEGTQLHPSYVQYYHAGMPWELLFLDLDNGAQLMLAVLAFHETEDGLLTPIVGAEQPTYRILATLRLPDGRSVVIPEEQLDVEHLNYKTIIGRVPTFWVSVTGIWRQSWDYRVSYDGGPVEGPDGGKVRVPAFDFGLEPQFEINEPAVNAEGDGPTQRVPYFVSGSYDRCPIDGYGFSELIVNWYGYEDKDPWYTGGELPGLRKRCGARPGPERDPGAGDPPIGGPPSKNPNKAEACTAFNPGTPKCEYVAASDGGITGLGGAPGAWKVTISRPGVPRPIVVPGFGGFQSYQCGTITPGDSVLVEAEPGGGATVGNPGFCFESSDGGSDGGAGWEGGDSDAGPCAIAIRGDRDANRLRGGAASELLKGFSGDDSLRGAASEDCLWGGSGADQLRGGGGDDLLRGQAGADRLAGAGGEDELRPGPGSDVALGGRGDDTIEVRGGGRDRVACGAGDDTVRADRGDRVADDCERVRYGD